VVDGSASSATGIGVRGVGHRGVRGEASTTTGTGVFGEGPALG
jgi:hypothetical protein